MDFNIKNLWSINIGGTNFWITETIRNTWIIMFILILIALVVRIALARFADVPTKAFQNIVELSIESFGRYVGATAGNRVSGLAGWFFTVFAFILLSNTSALFRVRPPTADWATAVALAVTTFVLTHVMGFKYQKGRYLQSFFKPFAVFFPLNLVGELARPISLSFRLFGNVLAGVILIELVYALLPLFLSFGIPAFLHGFFDVFAGVLQTYIFCTLSLAFIGSAAYGE